jgi:hypothetical protein
VHADRSDPELDALADERLANPRQARFVIIEPPRAAARIEEVGEVRERLPRDDRIPARGLLHPVEHGFERADVR